MTGFAQFNLTSSDGTISQAALGQEINVKGAVWRYFKASAAISAYQSCIMADDGTIQPSTIALSTTVPSIICIPQFAFASGEYGWAPVGPFLLREDDVTAFKVISKIAAKDVAMYTNATAGSVDDSTAGSAVKIQGLNLTAAQTVDDTATACIAVTRLVVNC